MGLFVFCSQANAQISTREVPIGFKYDIGREQMPVIVMPAIDTMKLQAEDKEEELLGIPPRFGYIHSVNLNFLDMGFWHTLENGDKLCRLTIVCPNALSVNLLYDRFWLPEGAKFFIYNQSKKHHIGAFTDFNNKSTKNAVESFATGLVYGDTIILEYYLPKNCTEKAIISISGIVHGYRYILPEYGYGNVPGNGFNLSGNCQVNINCSEGDNWQNEKRAVALVIVGGSRMCTGSLINNTNKDNSPYFLTADHCLVNEYGARIYDAINNPNLNNWTFYWNYELPPNPNDCNYDNTTPSAPFAFSTSGALVVANNGTSVSDFALLKLTEDPKYFTNYIPSFDPYYLGWDRTGSSGTGGVGIHHPRGDVKKIATHNQTPMSSGSYWSLYWMQTINGYSVTEGGSSGSPLINSNRHIIGQLYGGSNIDCSDPSNDIGLYGKFSVSWTGNNDALVERRLDHWLDPLGTNQATLDGWGSPTLSGLDIICSSGTYTLNSGTAATWTVTPSNVFTILSRSPGINSVVVKSYSVAGASGTLTVTTTNGVTITKSIKSCKASISGSGILCANANSTYTLTGIPTDLTISNTSWTASNGITLTSPALQSVFARNTTVPLIVATYPLPPVVTSATQSGSISARVTINNVNSVIAPKGLTLPYHPVGTIVGPMNAGGYVVNPTQPGYYKFTVGNNVPSNADVRWVSAPINSSNPNATADLHFGRTATIYLDWGVNEVRMQYSEGCINSNPAVMRVAGGYRGGGATDTTNTGIDAEALSNELVVQLSPNPVKNSMDVTVEDTTQPILVTVYSSSGIVYLSQTFTTPTFTMDLSRCQPGMLVVRISCGDKYVVKNILKQ